MRQTGKRFICFWMLLALLVGISGCGTSSPQPDNATTAQTAEPATSSPEEPEGLSGEITTWGWADQSFLPLIDWFTQMHPDVKINYVSTAGHDYATKIQTALAANMEMPDIAWLSGGIHGRLMAFNCWEDLEAAPYNFDRNLYYEYATTMGTDESGKVVGLLWDMAHAGLAYKKNLTREYFGTDDPYELEEIFSSWDDFAEKGKIVQEQSNGKVFMFASTVDLSFILAMQSKTPIFEDSTVNLTETYDKIIKTVVNLRDAGVVDSLESWTPSWNASFAKDENIFYWLATWTPSACLIPNDPDSVDRWGMMLPPGGGFHLGGTLFAIPTAAENKELAWEFVKAVLLTPEGAQACKAASGLFIPYKPIYDDPDFSTIKYAQFGDLDLGNVFFERVASTMPIRSVSRYDHFEDDARTIVMQAIAADPDLTYEAAVEKFKEELLNRAPELEFR